MTTINEKDLRKGLTLRFETTDTEDFRAAELSFEESKHTWATGFKIWFNGALIHSSKTFKPAENRLNRLIEKWNLKLI